MSLWFFLWILLSGALLFFAGWIFYITYRQKQSWRAFANKSKLRYSAKKNFMSPEVSGVMDGFTVTMFTSEHTASDRRGARKMSAIELNLKSRLPFSGSAGSGVMVGIVQNLAYKGELKPEGSGWNAANIIRATNPAAMESYMTPERLEALSALMKGKGISIIFIFEKEETLLRLDTPDPLDTIEKIEKAVRALIKTAQALELKEGEAQRLATIADKPKEVAAPKLVEPEAPIGLQLED